MASTTRQPAQQAVDVIAILDSQSGRQLFELARPMAATVFEVASLMEHPLENGAKIADHIVFEPIEIEMPLVLTGDQLRPVFSTLRQTFRAGTILTVQTRTDNYSNMVLMEVPHDETAEMSDGVTIGVRFREAMFVQAAYGGLAPKQVKRPSKASTVQKGNQQTQPASGPATAQAGAEYKGSTLYRLTR